MCLGQHSDTIPGLKEGEMRMVEQNMRQGGGQPVQVKTKRKIVKERWFLIEELKMSEKMAQEKAENEGKISKARSKMCGMCDQCKRGDCGVCNHCKDMTKFGGSGKSKQACKERKCNNMAVKEKEDSSSETDEPVVEKCKRGDCGVCNHCKDMTKFGGSGKSKQACKERKCNNMAVKEKEDSSSETDEPVVEKLTIKTCIVKYCQVNTSHFMCADHMKIPIRYE